MPRPDNDGTNACAFLSVQIAHAIHQLHAESRESMDRICQDIVRVSEEVIKKLPLTINQYRNKEQMYDALSAYSLLRKTGSISVEYSLSEEFVTPDPVFSEKGRNELIRTLQRMVLKKGPSIAVYTCEPLMFTVGCVDGAIFNLDTDPVPEVIGGRERGLLKVFPHAEEESCVGVCKWIWRRLLVSGVGNGALQSLSFLTTVSG